MKPSIALVICWLGGCCLLTAQTYPDYFGKGHQVGLTVYSSDTTSVDSAQHTVSGTGEIPDLAGASRFLAQATLGYTYEDVEYVSQIGIDSWLDEQLVAPDTSYLQAYFQNLGVTDLQDLEASGINSRPRDLSHSFYELVATRPDRLRQKLAFALSQILVTSYDNFSAVNNRGYMIASYYDLLYQGAFGNYRDLLQQVTLHPMMGMYLSSVRNQKADYGLNTQPDENYAREVMQLFTIGLLQLNNDGTVVLDANGQAVATYDNDDIQELAKVFTGLSYAEQINGTPADWDERRDLNRIVPMAMFGTYHDVSAKRMIDGSVLPAGRSDLADVNDALDLLFEHPNTGPFLSYRLIQQFVTSNPSPGYVNRVATVFNDNGQGVRGDLSAVVRAILTDPEARDCQVLNDPRNGKLIQPLERLTHVLTAFKVYHGNGTYWLRDEREDNLGQALMKSPTVFNYFSPFYSEESYAQPEGMVSPEFEILNAITAIENLNATEDRIKRRPFFNRFDSNNHPSLGLSEEIAIMQNQGLQALLDRLDILLCRGQLSPQTRSLITQTITAYQSNINNYSAERAVEDALYFIQISPDYLIQK